MGMKRNVSRAWLWMAAVVVAHLLVSFAHGAAHTGAQVPLSLAANLFVWIVVLLGPLAGLAVSWPARRAGSWLVAVTLAASFVFGVVNHFVIASPDHVAHVDPQWRSLFATTAVLLAATELAGAILALRVVRGLGASS
jgi:hypothetical protein